MSNKNLFFLQSKKLSYNHIRFSLSQIIVIRYNIKAKNNEV